jgi:ferrous iron transport protein B
LLIYRRCEVAIGAAPVLQSFVLEGVMDGVGTVVTFVPIVFALFVAMPVAEDSGYRVRVAFLMDRWMAQRGLNRRLFVMQLMGLGCNVLAMMGTRIVRSRPRRLLSMLTIPFSLCSAHLQVMVFLTAALFTPRTAPLVMFALYLTGFAVVWRGPPDAGRRDPDLAADASGLRRRAGRRRWPGGWRPGWRRCSNRSSSTR